eukprot:PITA_23053
MVPSNLLMKSRSPKMYSGYKDLITELVEIEPYSFKEEIEQLLMVEEYESIVKNIVWEVVPRLADKLVVGLRWIFKVNHVVDGRKKKYKDRFVAKGFSQVEGIDYEETFSLGARSCKKDLAREFEIKDMGLMRYFLGLEVWQGDGKLFVSQGKYENEILQIFDMESCKPMETSLATNLRKEDATSIEEVDASIYQKLVGSLMYLVNTRPDMCYEFNRLSQAMVSQTKLYWKETKHVLRCLKSTTQYGL